MKNTLLIILSFYTLITTSQDVYNLQNYEYAIVINSDTLIYVSGVDLYTNANYVIDAIAYKVDSVKILDSLYNYLNYIYVLPDLGIVKRGEIYKYNDQILRVIQNHDRSTVSHYDPHDVPALYLFRNISGCSTWIQPTGAHDAYNIGDCIIYNGINYISKINANVWSPDAYPQGWELQ